MRTVASDGDKTKTRATDAFCWTRLRHMHAVRQLFVYAGGVRHIGFSKAGQDNSRRGGTERGSTREQERQKDKTASAIARAVYGIWVARIRPNHNWPQALRLCSGPPFHIRQLVHDARSYKNEPSNGSESPPLTADSLHPPRSP